MKAYVAIFALLLLAPGLGLARPEDQSRGSVLSAAPTTEAGLVENGLTGRAPSSAVMNRNAKNRQLCEKIEPGQRFMIKNSVHDWDNRVAYITDKYDDCSVRVRLENGKRAFVRFKNLNLTLSPQVKCLPSNGTQICQGDVVFYPKRTSSMELPEAAVTYAFAHGVVLIRDGIDLVYDADQVGKSVPCSPQKESLCVGDYGYANGFKIDRAFNFEGPILKTYTNGVVVIEADKLWKFPIDASAVKKRVASEDGLNDPGVITNHGSQGKTLPYNVTPEIMPSNPSEADRVMDAR